jgi:putative drug exporter of the RND superfamily
MTTTSITPGPAARSKGGQPWLGRCGGWCYDHRRLVAALWAAVLIALLAVGVTAGGQFRNNYSQNSAPSQQAQQLLAQRFPATAGTTADVVIRTAGPVTATASEATTARMVTALRALPGVSGVTSPFSAAGRDQVSRDGHIAFAAVQFGQPLTAISNGTVSPVITTAQSFARPGYQVALGGPPISQEVGAKPGPSEGIGIGAAIIIMLLAFGSVAAMGLPIVTALFGVGAGIGIERLLSHLLVIPTFGSEMLAMIGLGVGIDYSLFIVTRYRQGLAEGRDPRGAVTAALATSGRAVLFAGCTVIISLCGLFIVGLPFMQGLSAGAIVAVALVMTAALTLLPAMLGFAGQAVDRLHLPGLLQRGASRGRGFWYRWSRSVQRRPRVTGIAALAVLVVLAIPLFSIRLAFTDAGNDPTSLTTRQSFDLLAEGFGPGFNGPLLIAAELPASGGGSALADRLDTTLRATPGVAFVTPPRINPAGNTAVIIAYPTTSPQAAQTAQLVTSLRDRVLPRLTAGTGAKVLVGGETAASVDAAAYLSSRLPWVIAVVIAAAFVLLMAVFRSLVIPLQAAIMNLLSAGAAYGVIVAVFQWGWAGSIIGIGAGPIDPWIPLMMFTILFGLSMDYEVFLLSRVREEWRQTGDNAAAVADGLAVTARVITAAAAIMVCVFGSFVIGDPLRVVKVFGLGLAAAILIDATLVRLLLVPAVMELTGKLNWYLPRWLDRIVPALATEGSPEPTPADERGTDAEPAIGRRGQA